MGCYYVVTDHIGGARYFPAVFITCLSSYQLRQKWISSSSADQKNQFPDVWSRTKLKVVRAVFLPKPSPGSPRLRVGPDVDLPTSRASKAELGGRKIYNWESLGLTFRICTPLLLARDLSSGASFLERKP